MPRLCLVVLTFLMLCAVTSPWRAFISVQPFFLPQFPAVENQYNKPHRSKSKCYAQASRLKWPQIWGWNIEGCRAMGARTSNAFLSKCGCLWFPLISECLVVMRELHSLEQRAERRRIILRHYHPRHAADLLLFLCLNDLFVVHFLGERMGHIQSAVYSHSRTNISYNINIKL